ncbi:MAG: hypothetical protein SGCHY_000395 [Lobulomycetales sp.]
MSTLELPVINLALYLSSPDSPEARQECVRAAEALQTYSAFALRDPRVPMEANDAFIDMQEDYFSQPFEKKEGDIRPDLHYQVGPTPELTEKPKCGGNLECMDMVKKLAPEDKPSNFTGFGKFF